MEQTIGSSVLDGNDPLRGFPPFRLLDRDSGGRLAACARLRKFTARQTVLRVHAPADSVFGIVKGSVKITITSREGREIVLARLVAGDIFGEAALFDWREQTADVVALTNCELLELQRRDLLPALERNPLACLRLLELVCDRLRHSNDQIAELFFLELPARLARALLRLASGSAGTGAGRKIALSQRELGVMVGASRESVNRCLKDWERSSIVRLVQGWIHLVAPNELRQIADLT